MVNFMKESIPSRASILAPITELTKKDVKFEWTKERDDCFNKCKAVISERILTTYPDPNEPFYVWPDASGEKGMGAVLMQDDKVVSTFSAKYNDVRLNYAITDKEFLAAHLGCRHFHGIITGCEVHIMCDHKNLTYRCQTCESLCLKTKVGA